MIVRRWSTVSPKSMYLICCVDEHWHGGEIVCAKVVWAIRAFWVWELLYRKKKK